MHAIPHAAVSCVQLLLQLPTSSPSSFSFPQKRERIPVSLFLPPSLQTKKHISSFILHFVLAYEKREEKETWHMLAICKTFLPSNFSSSLLLLPITRWRLEKDRHHLTPLAPPLIFVYDWAIIRQGRTILFSLHILLSSSFSLFLCLEKYKIKSPAFPIVWHQQFPGGWCNCVYVCVCVSFFKQISSPR